MLHNINQKAKKRFGINEKYTHFPKISTCADAADYFLESALELAYELEANYNSRDIVFPYNIIFGDDQKTLKNGI